MTTPSRSSAERGAHRPSREPRVTPTSPPTTDPPTTTTTVDPGTLPQTGQLPSSTDPTFEQRMDDLAEAVASGNTQEAAPAFFPLSVYVQVKDIYDPQEDYQDRLIADYDQDITVLHASLDPSGGGVQVSGIDAPAGDAGWIEPGVEYNKGSYWRVYDSTVDITVAGQPEEFTIASLISWRGQWYVVHLSSIR